MKNISERETPLDSRQLNAFVTLAETGSFTETARRLSLTQSAVSHSMRALETETHCRLLTKMGKTVLPTEAGEALLHHVRLGLKEFDKGREALEHLKKWGRRRLRIGARPAVSQYFLPGIMAALRRQHPKLAPSVKTIFSPDEAGLLRRGEIDCAVGEEPTAAEDLEFTPLFRGPLRAVVPPSHRWPARAAVPLEELAREPWLVPPMSSPLRRVVERALARHGAALNVLGEMDNLETIKQLIHAGMGGGFLPEWMLRNEIRDHSLRVLPFALPEMRQTWGLLRWRQRRPMDTVEVAFRNLCLKAGKKFAST